MVCDEETLLIDPKPGDDLKCELDILEKESSSIATAVSCSEADLAGKLNATFFGASVDCWVRTSLSSRKDESPAVAWRSEQPRPLCLCSGQATDCVQKLFPLAIGSG